jgi:hypothetical protein
MIHIPRGDRQRLRILNQVTIPSPVVRGKLQNRASDTEKGVALKIVAVATDSADGMVGAPLVALAVRERERELVHGRAAAAAVRELGRDRSAVWPAERLGLRGPDLGVLFASVALQFCAVGFAGQRLFVFLLPYVLAVLLYPE